MLVFMTVPKGWSFHRVSTLLPFTDSHPRPLDLFMSVLVHSLQEVAPPLLVLHKDVHPRQNVAFFPSERRTPGWRLSQK